MKKLIKKILRESDFDWTKSVGPKDYINSILDDEQDYLEMSDYYINNLINYNFNFSQVKNIRVSTDDYHGTYDIELIMHNGDEYQFNLEQLDYDGDGDEDIFYYQKFYAKNGVTLDDEEVSTVGAQYHIRQVKDIVNLVNSNVNESNDFDWIKDAPEVNIKYGLKFYRKEFPDRIYTIGHKQPDGKIEIKHPEPYAVHGAERYKLQKLFDDGDYIVLNESNDLDWIKQVPTVDEFRFFEVVVCIESEYDEYSGEDECLDVMNYFFKIPKEEVDGIWDNYIGYFGGPGDEGRGVINWGINMGIIDEGDYITEEYVTEHSKTSFCHNWGYSSDDENDRLICNNGINESSESDFDWAEDANVIDGDKLRKLIIKDGLTEIYHNVVNGYLFLYGTKIKSLGNLQTVGGGLDLRGAPIQSLGNLESVGGYLDLDRTKIQSLGNLKSVGGNLDLKGTPIQSLGNLESVGGNLDLRGSVVSKEYSKQEIREMVSVDGEIYL